MSFDRPSSPALVADESSLARPVRTDLAAGSPLSIAQRQLLGRPGDEPDGVVARHWERAIWSDFDLESFIAAAERIATTHPLSRSRLAPDGRQYLDGTFPDPLVRVTDARRLDDEASQRVLAAECETLCLTGDGKLGRPWQAHALMTASGSTWITVAFARVFFDRTSIARLLDDLCAACGGQGAAAAVAPPDLEPFQVFCHASPDESANPATTTQGPDVPRALEHRRPPSPRVSRESVRLKAETWSQIRTRGSLYCGPLFTTEALIGAAGAYVLTLWSRTPRFSIQLDVDARSEFGAGRLAAGQFARPVIVPVEGEGDRSFEERLLAFARAAGAGRLARDADGSASFPEPRVVVSSWKSPFPASGGRPSSDRFVFVGSSRPGTLLEIHGEDTAEGSLHVHLDAFEDPLAPDLLREWKSAIEALLVSLARDEAWRCRASQQVLEILPAAQLARRAMTNATAAAIPEGLLHDGFLEHARKQPAAPALITRSRTLSYGELHGRACALAHRLRDAGATRNTLVAVAAQKGWEQIAGVLGVTLAGAAYLPIDLELPAERIAALLALGECTIVVSHSAARAIVAPLAGDRTLIEVDALEPVGRDIAPPAVETGPDDLAYVIFTSGSTGTPKGVMISHRGALNTIVDLNARFSISPDDRVLALSRLSFDLSVYDIFGLLAAGGALVLPDPEGARDPAHWAELVRDHKVTLWNTVPALMQLLVDLALEAGADVAASLRLVWMSGDWIPLALPARIRAIAPRAQIISMGGATEASIWSILYPVGDVDPHWRSVPYGKPLLNQTFHVLRPDLTPAPDFVAGELFIGGIGVAQGYWRQPELTAARFITHPRSGERLYRTGDLGRMLPDGNIEFLGRADFQVKIRGFRIELGEIEAALRDDPRVKTAVVVAAGDSDASRELVAYVIGESSEPLPETDILDALRRRLPDYMIPARLVRLERLPLTANGKVDLKALPALERSAARTEPTKPANEIEEILLELWREILGLRVLGTRDDFFASGGNSLSGTRMMLRLRAAFALTLPVETLFQTRTIQKLAAVVEERLLADIEQQSP